MLVIRDWTETQDIPYREEEELRIDAIQDAVTVTKTGGEGGSAVVSQVILRVRNVTHRNGVQNRCTDAFLHMTLQYGYGLQGRVMIQNFSDTSRGSRPDCPRPRSSAGQALSLGVILHLSCMALHGWMGPKAPRRMATIWGPHGEGRPPLNSEIWDGMGWDGMGHSSTILRLSNQPQTQTQHSRLSPRWGFCWIWGRIFLLRNKWEWSCTRPPGRDNGEISKEHIAKLG